MSSLLNKAHLKIRVSDWLSDEVALREIRTQVFMQEQGVSATDEWDDRDQTAIHFLVYADSHSPIACARMFCESIHQEPVFHIGRVAVLKPYRNLGVGRELMTFVLAHCQALNPSALIYLHAQTDRQVFYEHLHFKARGEIFMDANIPHIEMWYTP